MSANILSPEDEIAKLLALIGQPARIQILLGISSQEACVCHLEAVTGMRQASISQHLMVLRKAGLVTPNRAGRNIYYRLVHAEILSILEQSALLAGISRARLDLLSRRPAAGCACPQCSGLAQTSCCKSGEVSQKTNSLQSA